MNYCLMGEQPQLFDENVLAEQTGDNFCYVFIVILFETLWW